MSVLLRYHGGMTNAADTLADLLDSWEVPSQKTPVYARLQNDRASSLSFWRRHAHAVEMLCEVEHALNGLEAIGKNADHFRQDLVPIYQAIFGYSPGWGHKVPVEGLLAAPLESIKMLRSLGMVLDANGMNVEYDQADLESLQEALEEADRLLDEVPNLSSEERVFLYGLLAEARQCVEEVGRFGAARVRTVTFTLNGALVDQAVAAHARGDEHLGARFFDLGRRLTSWIFVRTGDGALNELGKMGVQALGGAAGLELPPGK